MAAEIHCIAHSPMHPQFLCPLLQTLVMMTLLCVDNAIPKHRLLLTLQHMLAAGHPNLPGSSRAGDTVPGRLRHQHGSFSQRCSSSGAAAARGPLDSGRNQIHQCQTSWQIHGVPNCSLCQCWSQCERACQCTLHGACYRAQQQDCQPAGYCQQWQYRVNIRFVPAQTVFHCCCCCSSHDVDVDHVHLIT